MRKDTDDDEYPRLPVTMPAPTATADRQVARGGEAGVPVMPRARG